MFDVFCEWVQSAPWGHEVDVRFKVGEPCDNRSVRLEIDTEDFVAEIVVWTSDDYVVEIIDIRTEQSLYRTSGVWRPDERPEEVFAVFFETLGIRLK